MAARTPWPGSSTSEVPYDRLAPRRVAGYMCQRGHRFEVTFAAAAIPPEAWTCRCGAPAGDVPPEPPETTWQHHRRLVGERRTPAEAAAILAERLTEIRGKQ